jgi:hypothetical protein
MPTASHSRCAPTRVLALAITFLLAWTSNAPAQITAATISGTVKDQTGGMLPGADIVVHNVETGLTRTAVADPNGLFTIPGLPPGTYEARASLQGFTTEVTRVALTVAQTAAIGFALRVAGTAENVEVVASAALVDTQNSALSAVVPEKTITELPLNGRNYIQLATLQPGVTSFAGAGTGVLNINGLPVRSNAVLLDGANIRVAFGATVASETGTTLGVETIREFRVVTNAYSADYGRAMGGVVTLVSKSGTNNVHGSAFEFFRDSKMDARNFFDPGDPPPFTRHQFGAAGGGPIRKDRIFFYGGVERLRENLGQTQVLSVPSAAVRQGAVNPGVRPYLDLYPLPNGTDLGGGIGQFTFPFTQTAREIFAQGRIDYTLSQKDSLFGRYTFDNATKVGPVGLPQFASNAVTHERLLTIEEKRIWTSALLNTARVSYVRIDDQTLPDQSASVPSSLSFESGQALLGFLTVGGLSSLGNGPTFPSTQDNRFFTVSDDIVYTRGRHVLKIGALVERSQINKVSGSGIRGAYQFLNLQQFLAGRPTRYTGVYFDGPPERQRYSLLSAFYLQDDFRTTSRVTLNLGLRYEFFTVPADRDGRDSTLRNLATDATYTVGTPFINPSLKNFGPRLGFAWNVAGDGRTSIRGGAGLFYDTNNTFESSLGTTQNVPPFVSTIQVTNPAFPRTTVQGGTAVLSPRALDYHIEQPKAASFNVNVQRELWSDVVATVGYAGSRGYNIPSAADGNPVVPQTLADGTEFFPAGAPRRNPNFGFIDLRTTAARSWYNALQASANKRFSKGYQLQVSYTLGKTLDLPQAQLAGDSGSGQSSPYPMDPWHPELDKGPANYDVRHVLNGYATWELPPGPTPLLTGWQINGIVTLRSGMPFTPGIVGNWSRSGNTSGIADRVILKPGVDPDSIILGGVTRYFDPSAFMLPSRGTLSTLGRNTFRGPRFANVDLSLVKNTRVGALGNAGSVQFRLEVFNLLNHPNFATPDRQVFAGVSATEAPLPTAGRITSTVTTSRQVQLGVKVIF